MKCVINPGKIVSYDIDLCIAFFRTKEIDEVLQTPDQVQSSRSKDRIYQGGLGDKIYLQITKYLFW